MVDIGGQPQRAGDAAVFDEAQQLGDLTAVPESFDICALRNPCATCVDPFLVVLHALDPNDR
ncbi:hypothetical protein [Actinacidiphila soli]|uniref:hypothetical protein n=1 Tax=Actinacidiphila soli TaxID=2487275 RepID=UPI000FCBC036|nr:hypothetical protein [Actinacidiphila soli]